ncbi:MAG: competence/damage-inducible protein A [Bacteroidetes bacterium]|jgi:nicotinamide-nucleotide amidase|nr:competence/damage-inducible protein A [Bacteroidota bacterium]MBT6685748.1 competence/damage-inducible protein A [Bacteroidota bacterium]MBT7142951.1 competence/damage-inducible protein A [Bacteroidota bacterium]MBT7491861.1 competence/damage-inducible protein A [Bacteroidota bacterium]
MDVEIITIGDELLIGQVVDTNSAWMAEHLNMNGLNVYQITSISDNRNHIFDAIDTALERAEIILLTGGLGPTKDDITKNTLCEYFDTHLIMNDDVLAKIKKFLSSRKSALNELNRQQALVPENCKIIQNENGTAPALWFEKNNKVIVSMPGVPFEMKQIMSDKIIPALKNRFKTKNIIHKTVLVAGLFEAQLAEILHDWEEQLPANLKLAYLPSPGRIRLRFSIVGENREDLLKIIDNEIIKLKAIIPDSVFGFEEDTLEKVVGDLLKKKKLSLSTAESCTGGNIAHLLTSVAGSSEYFVGSVVAYSNNIKENILKVSRKKIEKYGAVSQEVVEEMAVGIRKLFDTDYAIATSGVAGPGGGTEEKPVGTVWIAISEGNRTISKKYLFGKNRERNISKTSSTALNLLRNMLLKRIET